MFLLGFTVYFTIKIVDIMDLKTEAKAFGAANLGYSDQLNKIYFFIVGNSRFPDYLTTTIDKSHGYQRQRWSTNIHGLLELELLVCTPFMATRWCIINLEIICLFMKTINFRGHLVVKA